MPATNPVMYDATLTCVNWWTSGIPIAKRGYSAPMKFQKKIWTSTGVPRKNQMYIQLAPETSGFGERRMTARTMPSVMPIAIEVTVSSSVRTSPCRIGLEPK